MPDEPNADLLRNLRAAQQVANNQSLRITNLEFELAKAQDRVRELEAEKAQAQADAGEAPDLPKAQPNPNRKTRRAAAKK